MKLSITLIAAFLLLSIASTYALTAEEEKPVIDSDIIRRVNSDPTSTWRAGYNGRFHGVKVAEFRKMLGAFAFTLQGEEDVPVSEHKADISQLPTNFDSRDKWSNCIHAIRNQEQCGSCWAFSASEVLSDRMCIEGGKNLVLSPQYLVSCDKSNYGCQGGMLPKAWQFLENTGIPTDKCVPYTSGSGNVESCPSQCDGGGSIQTYKASSYSHVTGVSSIQSEIHSNGPVQAAFKVYRDFMQYSGGVYKHQYGAYDGGHAIKIIGWGVEGSTPYWLVANSWGTSWGLNGYFKILKGQNECGIESSVYAGKSAQ